MRIVEDLYQQSRKAHQRGDHEAGDRLEEAAKWRQHVADNPLTDFTEEGVAAGNVSFPRLEAWLKREPPRHSLRRCKCGEADAWRCWIRTYGAVLLRSGGAE